MRGRRCLGAVVMLSEAALLVASCAAPAAPSPAATDAGPALWRPVAGAVLSGRHSAHGFWTGSEVLLLGGDGALPRCQPQAHCIEASEPVADGVAFDLGTGARRPLRAAPVALGNLTAAIVEGTLHTWVPGRGEAEGLFLAYRIAEDRWDELPRPPAPESGLRLLAAGQWVVAYRPSHEAGVRPDHLYDTSLGRWIELPPDPLAPAFDRAMVWTGRDLVALGIRIDPARAANAPPTYSAAALDPGGEWRRLPDSEIAGWNPAWFWSGGSIVNPTLGSADGGEVNNWGRHFPFGGLLTPPAAEWSPLPDLPPGSGDYRGLSVGGPEHVVSDGGWILHVPTGRWTPLPRPPDGPDHGEAVVWAGDALVVWGGVRWDGDEPSFVESGWAWTP